MAKGTPEMDLLPAVGGSQVFLCSDCGGPTAGSQLENNKVPKAACALCVHLPCAWTCAEESGLVSGPAWMGTGSTQVGLIHGPTTCRTSRALPLASLEDWARWGPCEAAASGAQACQSLQAVG